MLSLTLHPVSPRFSWLKLLSVLFIFTVLVFPDVRAQDDLSVFGYWKLYDGIPAVSLYKHLYERASDQLEKRQKTIAGLKTRADWQKRQAFVKAKLAEAVGPFPARTPLRPVITGTLNREGFTVEKLYFESRPGYYVTAACFFPEAGRANYPPSYTAADTVKTDFAVMCTSTRS